MPIYEDLGVALRLVFSDSPDDCEHRYHLNKQSHSMKAHPNHKEAVKNVLADFAREGGGTPLSAKLF